MTTEEGNRTIAEWMGVEYKKDDYGDFGYFFPDQSHRPAAIEALKYHTSWDWLMPVVEKIYLDHQNGKHIGGTHLDIFYTPISASIEQVWQAVVQFIQWLNNQSQLK